MNKIAPLTFCVFLLFAFAAYTEEIYRFSATSLPSTANRIWTMEGNRAETGRLIEVVQDGDAIKTITLAMADGKEIKAPLGHFVKRDQDYVWEIMVMAEDEKIAPAAEGQREEQRIEAPAHGLADVLAALPVPRGGRWERDEERARLLEAARARVIGRNANARGVQRGVNEQLLPRLVAEREAREVARAAEQQRRDEQQQALMQFRVQMAQAWAQIVRPSAQNNQTTNDNQAAGKCSFCNGRGYRQRNCSYCKGTGRDSSGNLMCSGCDGKGFEKCGICRGTGTR